MSDFFGTGLNQSPRNFELGEAAYWDLDQLKQIILVDTNVDLSDIRQSIDNTNQNVTNLDNATLKKNANLSDLTNKDTARDNLGLGTAATRNVGTSKGNVMEVGAWNWGHMRTPESGLDFNDFENRNLYPESGASYLYSTANQNGPTSAGTHVLTMKLAGEYQAQLGIQNSGRAYVRAVSEGTITPWRELVSTGNILKSTGNNNEFPMSQKAVTDALNNKVTIGRLATYSGSEWETSANGDWAQAPGDYVVTGSKMSSWLNDSGRIHIRARRLKV